MHGLGMASSHAGGRITSTAGGTDGAATAEPTVVPMSAIPTLGALAFGALVPLLAPTGMWHLRRRPFQSI